MTANDAHRRGPAWAVQAAAMAQRHYLEGRSKKEVAEEFGVSRFKVARMLDDAIGCGLVEFHINLPVRVDPTLSTELQQLFRLRRVLVVEGSAEMHEGSPAHQHLSQVAAQLLSELVTETDVLGLTCSRNVTATTEALTELPSCRVVQLTGTLAGAHAGPGSVESVRRAAAIGNGVAFPIYAPMVLPDTSTARSLAGQADIKAVMDLYGDVTIALVSIGAWAAGASSVWQIEKEQDRRRADRAGAVGEIGARLFDASGAAVHTPLDARVLGITLEQLRDVPEVIALAVGAARRDAIRAALGGGLVTTLVCDEDLARALLDAEAGRTPERTKE